MAITTVCERWSRALISGSLQELRTPLLPRQPSRAQQSLRYLRGRGSGPGSARLSRLSAPGPPGQVAVVGEPRLHGRGRCVAILAGIVAGSIALIGFGIDSAIEGFASAVIVWRFTGHRIVSDAAETRAQKLVAVQFFVLAPYVGFESIKALAPGRRRAELLPA